MPQAIFAYHLGMDAEQYAFFRIPKLLITEPYFRWLSTDAKLLYGLMLDRMSLSMRNGWMDDDGHVYIYFTLEEACEQLCCKTDKAVKLFAELDSAKGVGLIRRVKQGLGRPAKIYVLRFMGMEDEPGEDMLTINALTAADSVIIPVQAQYLPAKGLEQLLRTITRVKRQLNPKLEVDGIVLTMVDSRTTLAREINALVRKTYGGHVFASEIPRSIKAAEISVENKSIYDHDRSGKAALAYENLTREALSLGKQIKRHRADPVR